MRIKSYIRFADIELAQDRLAMCRRRSQHAIGNLAVLVFRDEVNARLTCLADAADEVNDGAFTRIERDARPDCDHWIEYGARAPR